MKNNKIKLNDRLIDIIAIILIVIIALIMIIFSKFHILGIDELDWTLRMIDTDSIAGIFKNLSLYGYNLPLYYLILKPFFLINPLDEFLLKIPSFIFTIVGMVYVYKISKKMTNNKIALLSLMVLCSSFSLLPQIAWSIRPYALMFGLSSISLFYFIKKNEEQKWYLYLIYYIVITLLLFTHWFGTLIIFCYGVIDLVLLIKKKIKFKYFIYYIIPFLLIVFYTIYILNTHITTFSEYWPKPPEFKDLYHLLKYMVSYNWILIVILTIAVFIKNAKKKIKINCSFNDKLILCFCLYSIFIVLGVFIYSRFINLKSSFWVERYFIIILPHTILTFGYLAYKLFYTVKKAYSKHIYSILEFIAMSLAFLMISYNIGYSLKDPYSGNNGIPYSSLCSYILLKDDAYDSKTLIIVATGKYFIKQYIEYPNNKIPNNLIYADDLEQKKEYVFNDYIYGIKDGKYSGEKFKEEDIFNYDKIYLASGKGVFSVNEIIKLERYYKMKSFNNTLGLFELEKKGDV